MIRVIKNTSGCFVPISSIVASADVCSIEFKRIEDQLTDDDINIGCEARAYLVEHEDDIRNEESERFFETVRNF